MGFSLDIMGTIRYSSPSSVLQSWVFVAMVCCNAISALASEQHMYTVHGKTDEEWPHRQ